MAERRPKGPPAAAKASEAGDGAPAVARPPPAAEQALACSDQPGLSGSASGSFTYLLLRQACLALNHPARGDDPGMVEVDRMAARQFLRGVAPRDPVEGMLATQMLGLHEAAMECLGRATAPGGTGAARPRRRCSGGWRALVREARRLAGLVR